MKPSHKFFDRHLDNDLTSLEEFLLLKEQEIKDGKFLGISVDDAIEAGKTGCMATSLSLKYNVFQLHHPGIHNLMKAVREMTIEACDYYGIDFEKEQYYLQGWFNCDEKSDFVNDNPDLLHDHCGGTGIPFFHGYYCVNAEPSVTHYHIDREVMFDNVNKNNRAILSETGHPHRKGAWNLDSRRITIAYDMLPLRVLDDEDQVQHWIPLV
jgi:hypothetical protein